MSKENVELIRHAFELFASGDLDAVARLIAEDAEVADAGGLGLQDVSAGTRRGPEGFLKALNDVQDAFEGYTVEPMDFLDVGDAVVVPVRVTGTGRASGLEQEIFVAQAWTVRGGKVVRGEVFRDAEEAKRVLGERGPA